MSTEAPNPGSAEVANPFPDIAVVGNGQISLFAQELLRAHPAKPTLTEIRRRNFDEQLSVPYDMIILAIPTLPETDEDPQFSQFFTALSDKLKNQPSTTLVFPQNSPDITKRAVAFFPENTPHHFVKAAFFTPVHMQADGTIDYPQKHREMGFAPGRKNNDEDARAAAEVATMFRATGAETEVYKDAELMMWAKIVKANTVGTTAIVTGLTPRETFCDRDLFELETRAERDRYRILHALSERLAETGEELPSFPWVNEALLDFLGNLGRVSPIVPKAVRDFAGKQIGKRRNDRPPDATGKIAEGKKLTEKYWDVVIALGAQFGLESPVDETLHGIVEADEVSGINQNDLSLLIPRGETGVKLEDLEPWERKQLLLNIYQHTIDRTVSKPIQTLRHFTRPITNLDRFFPTIVTPPEGSGRPRFLSASGYGGIWIIGAHRSMGDPIRLMANEISPDPILGKRKVIMPWAWHRVEENKHLGDPLSSAFGVKYYGIVTQDSIDYYRRQKLTEKQIKEKSEALVAVDEELAKASIFLGKGKDEYLDATLPHLHEGGLAVIAPQGGREKMLDESKPTISMLVREAMDRGISNIYFTFSGIDIQRQTDDPNESVSGYNPGKTYEMTVGETLTLQELIELAKLRLPQDISPDSRRYRKELLHQIDEIIFEKMADVDPLEYLGPKYRQYRESQNAS